MKLDKLTPFNDTFGESIGRGKDNVVVPFNKTENLVVKWNHDLKINLDSKDNFQRILYKKRKYEMLKFFLPDFIPDSYFVLGNKQDGNRLKTKEYTLQKKYLKEQ